jgi:hypothetical protein
MNCVAQAACNIAVGLRAQWSLTPDVAGNTPDVSSRPAGQITHCDLASGFFTG